MPDDTSLVPVHEEHILVDIARVAQETEGSDLKKAIGLDGDRTLFPMAIEVFGELDAIIKGAMEDQRTPYRKKRKSSSPIYYITEFDETKPHRMFVFIPPGGTALYDAVRSYLRHYKGATVVLTLFQRIRRGDKKIGVGPRLLLNSCALMKHPTDWMVLDDAPPELMLSAGLSDEKRGRVFVRFRPPERSTRFFECVMQVYNKDRPEAEWATYHLSEWAEKELVVTPLTDVDRIYFLGLNQAQGLREILGEVAPIADMASRPLRQAQPFPAPAQLLAARQTLRLLPPDKGEKKE
ncbi:MAG TPA: hypothetical protein VEA36_02445 [Candidatus Paceibacterota bacterium]|nr:hypothetical protein [Candidatus Paceibacterota bacterium]